MIETPAEPRPLRCDVVLKGGVTSGVVYPRAVYEIAKVFRFVNIGGTSAGAIAATLTAAAEYRRQSSDDHTDFGGFTLMDAVPQWLAENDRLAKLFRPNRVAKPYFDFLTDFMGRGGLQRKGRTVFLTLFGPLLPATASGAAMGLVLGAAAVLLGHGLVLVPSVVAAVLLAVTGGVLTAAVTGLIGFLRAFAVNGYGLCSGIADGDDGADDTVLDAWLSRKIDAIAGMPESRPLTFGDLWRGRLATADDSENFDDVPDPAIRLEVVSTCVSHGRPYTFPTGNALLYFRPSELRRFLPGYVVDHMKAHARDAAERTNADGGIEDTAILQLPPDRDLPIVFAARLSLAFPVLLCPTRLYAIDFSKLAEKPSPEDCWFTDGGLSSNFPIQSFDAPLPRWPTFGINLGSFTERNPYVANDQTKNVWMPPTNSGGQRERWTRFLGPFAFFQAMLDAIRGWNDSVMMRMPGYRDRIVTVMLRDEEGGLNLDMPSATIKEIAERGAAAGRLLVKRFAAPSRAQFLPDMDWENQRVVRYRVTMDALQRYLAALEKAYRRPGQPDDVSYAKLVERGAESGVKLPAYDWKDPVTKACSSRATRRLAAVASGWRVRRVNFDSGAPKPEGNLAIRGPF